MRAGSIVLTPSEGGPYHGKPALVTSIQDGGFVSVVTGRFELLYRKEQLKEIGKITKGRRYKTRIGKEFQQFSITSNGESSISEIEVTADRWKTADLRLAAWVKYQERRS